MTEPTNIIIGDTSTWTRSEPDYPPSAGWALAYTLINANNKYTVNATTGDSDVFDVVVPVSVSTGWQAGQYKWIARVTRTVAMVPEAKTVGEGVITLQDNFAALETLDVRSHARKTLAAIEATLEGRATSATSEYQIAGRAMKYYTLTELLVFRDKYRREVAGEDAADRLAAGLPSKSRIYVRFGR